MKCKVCQTIAFNSIHKVYSEGDIIINQHLNKASFTCMRYHILHSHHGWPIMTWLLFVMISSLLPWFWHPSQWGLVCVSRYWTCDVLIVYTSPCAVQWENFEVKNWRRRWVLKMNVHAVKFLCSDSTSVVLLWISKIILQNFYLQKLSSHIHYLN